MNALRRLSIRWRITIGTLLIAAVLSAVAVVGFRAEVERIQASTTTTLLQHDATPYIAEIAAGSDKAMNKPGRGQLVAVVDPVGLVLETNLPIRLQPKVTEIITSGQTAHTIAAGDDVYRVLDQVVVTEAGQWHVVTARNQDSSALSLDRITQALVVAAVLLVAGFGIASWLLTGAALRPVTRMRRQAEALVAEGSTKPLPVGPATDEISALAITLNEFIVEVRQSVDRERQLVSDASHELRTPLAILRTQLELAHLSSGDAVALEQQIEAAERSVARISALATGMLELSQLEQPAVGRHAASTADDLADELAATVDRVRLIAAPRSITLDFEIAASSEPGLPADLNYGIPAETFGRLVGNLASNAVAAVEDGGWVRVAFDASGNGLHLVVADSGPGMPPEFIQNAFDRFSRPDTARAHGTGGAGLGLAIVHAIVTAAGGTVMLANAVDDQPGLPGAPGLTVTVLLPALPSTNTGNNL
ncbi:MAG: two-component system sensor protein [Microbacteriaceae bacterium]|nr:two-component system sensor protein [Microbacteriaceae bacterium]